MGFIFDMGGTLNKKLLMLVVVFAFCLIAVLILMYINNFGVIRSDLQADWGTFGDYFGGILNPVFGLCAFLGVLWSLDIQIKQLKQISLDKQGEELLVVIKDIDARIGELMNVEVGKTSGESLFIHHMVAECDRGAGVLGSSDAYTMFVDIARQSGSILEAPARELKNKIITLHRFLLLYPQGQKGGNAPVVEYYIDKISGLVKMLDEVGGVPSEVSDFFVNSRSRR